MARKIEEYLKGRTDSYINRIGSSSRWMTQQRTIDSLTGRDSTQNGILGMCDLIMVDGRHGIKLKNWRKFFRSGSFVKSFPNYKCLLGPSTA